MKLLVSIATLILCASANATILPPNTLYLQDKMQIQKADMSEEVFNKIIDTVTAQYETTFNNHGAKLVVEKYWGDPTVNAFADQQGDIWSVAMYGGLARRSEITNDGFALVMCHEIGHHLAGFPFYQYMDWAATEGQSDYYATQVCARKIWETDMAGNAAHRATIHPTAKAKCDATWSTEEDQNLCYRTAEASLSLAVLLGALNDEVPNYDTPSKEVVTATVESHPDAQCRLDTYVNGAACTSAHEFELIPGKSATDKSSKAAENEAAKNSCMMASQYTLGLRPACWFKERL